MRENTISTACAANYCYSQVFPLSIFERFEFLTYWKQAKTGRWEGLGTTLLQIKPVLTSYVLILIRPSSTIDSLRQIVILQLHRCKACSAATWRLHASRACLNRIEAGFKPPPGSDLQTGSQAGC